MIQHPKRVGYAYHIMKLSTKLLVKVILHDNVLFTYDTDTAAHISNAKQVNCRLNNIHVYLVYAAATYIYLHMVMHLQIFMYVLITIEYNIIVIIILSVVDQPVVYTLALTFYN